MSRKSKLRWALTAGIALFSAGPSFAQQTGYATPGQYAPSLHRAQLPLWNATPPMAQPRQTNQQFQPQAAVQPAQPQQAYSPSQMPSVNPFSNVRSHQQPVPAALTNSAQQQNGDQVPQYRPAQQQFAQQLPQQQFNTYSTAYGQSQFAAVGGGVQHSAPIQEVHPGPLQNSFYDQPSQNFSAEYDYGANSIAGGCDVVVARQGRSGWYGRVGAVIMNRDRENDLWLSYDQTDIRDRTLSSKDAGFSYAGGFAATIGHYFNCGRNSVEMSYWGIYPGDSEADSFGADTAAGIDSILHFDGLQYDAGAGAQDLAATFFFGAARHRVQRSYGVHNLELNLLGHNFSNCGPLQMGWVAGVRYLRFDDDFLYSTDPTDTAFTGAANEVHYDIDVENNLIGFQIGGRADWCFGARSSLFADTKAGLYGNHVSHRSRIFGSNGQAFVGDATSPHFGEDVDISSRRNDFAMIGDLSLGMKFCVNSCWSVTAGYRAVAVSGVALSTNQVPVDFIGALDSIRNVDTNGSLILHGAFVGVDYCY